VEAGLMVFTNPPKNLGRVINSRTRETDVFVAPDASFLIGTRREHPQNIGGGKADLHVSFIRRNGSWPKLLNPGCTIDTEHIGFRLGFSGDGKLFFFSGHIRELNEIMEDEHVP
jgi:hypothetical protein